MAQANSSNVASSTLSKSLSTIVRGTDDIVLTDIDEIEPDTRVWGMTTTVPLSKDHKPDDPKERDFILKAGTLHCSTVLTTDLHIAYIDVPVNLKFCFMIV